MDQQTTSKGLLWGGRVLSALPALGLFASAAMKLSRSPQVVQGFKAMGYPDSSILIIGIVEVLCTVLYLVPQTAVLGAILLTGYLGGAVSTHVRAGEGFAAPVLFGVLLWGGLFLRDPRLRALLPLRKP